LAKQLGNVSKTCQLMGYSRDNPLIIWIAFEADPEGRTILTRMAQFNGVASRITAEEFCTLSLLQDGATVKRCVKELQAAMFFG
jgi:hypothetical protein